MAAGADGAAGTADSQAIARRFVTARREARPLFEFPGSLPQTLTATYAIQDAAILLRGEPIAGWKVGRIPPEHEAVLHEQRLAGPIFQSVVQRAGSETSRFSIIEGGFAAIEAEFVFLMGKDADPARTEWTTADAAELVAALHVGIEVAASPLATINAIGPRAVVSDFGNNGGLILGPEIPDWRSRDPASLPCQSFIDGVSVGTGSAGALLDGPLGSLAFILGHTARRGRPLKAGQLIATGQTSGIHDIEIGQFGRIVFGAFGAIEARAEKQKAG